jgi:hypothetical protein
MTGCMPGQHMHCLASRSCSESLRATWSEPLDSNAPSTAQFSSKSSLTQAFEGLPCVELWQYRPFPSCHSEYPPLVGLLVLPLSERSLSGSGAWPVMAKMPRNGLSGKSSLRVCCHVVQRNALEDIGPARSTTEAVKYLPYQMYPVVSLHQNQMVEASLNVLEYPLALLTILSIMQVAESFTSPITITPQSRLG